MNKIIILFNKQKLVCVKGNQNCKHNMGTFTLRAGTYENYP